MLRTGGPHQSQVPLIANYPNFEEITTAKAAILIIIGEKGSDKRKQANELSKRGLLDQEEALGWYVCDRFNTIYPSDISWSAMRSGRVGWCGPLWALSPAPLPTVRALWAAQPTRMVGPGSNLTAEDLPGAR